MKKRYKLIRLSIPFILLLLWFVVSELGIWSSYLLPSPIKIFNTTVKLLSTGELLKHIFVSLARVIMGFIISFFIAFPIGIFMGLKNKVAYILNPLLEFFRHVPPLALIPLLILWFGIGEKSKMIVIILASFFPMLLNIIKGISSCDNKLIEVGKTFKFNKYELFMKIILPYAMKDIIVGMRIGLGYSWRAIIGAELIAASSGIGYMILDAQALSRPDKVIVGIFSIGLMGIFIDWLFRLITRKQKGM